MKSPEVPDEKRMNRCLDVGIKAFCFIGCPRVCVVEHFFDFTGEKGSYFRKGPFTNGVNQGEKQPLSL